MSCNPTAWRSEPVGIQAHVKLWSMRQAYSSTLHNPMHAFNAMFGNNVLYPAARGVFSAESQMTEIVCCVLTIRTVWITAVSVGKK